VESRSPVKLRLMFFMRLVTTWVNGA
jgi:hypothetical protein